MTQRIVLVTGNSRGLGKNAALKLVAKGTDILLTYYSNRQAAFDMVTGIKQKGVKAAALALNVGDSSTFDAFTSGVAQVLAQKWRRITFDYLLNNTEIDLNVPFAETSEAQSDELMNIQSKGPFFLTQWLLSFLQDEGRILNVLSGLTRLTLPDYVTYAATKEAMEALIRYQTKELSGRSISVNIIMPGAIETNFGGGVVHDGAKADQHIATQTALGRVGLPDDIGDAIAALLSDELV